MEFGAALSGVGLAGMAGVTSGPLGPGMWILFCVQ